MNNNERIAKQMGVSVEDVERMMKTLAYRKEYNSRPEVVEKRKQYARVRNANLSRLNSLLKNMTPDNVNDNK